MVSDREQTTPDPFLNPMEFPQAYLINYIQTKQDQNLGY
jgi:hypothetical protein